ncbi:MAG: hypothetical protein SGJ09_09735 [Phycisphaerae bacterium]|nr:hypothetical protein [Phycisphaerae bacterium]
MLARSRFNSFAIQSFAVGASAARGRRLCLGGLALVVMSAVAFGCQPKQTFPATVGRPVFDTNVPPMPDLCIVAVTTGHAKSSVVDEAIIYNLPPGMNKTAWDKVDAGLPESARPSEPGDAKAINVVELRIDGGKAEVDVVVPQGEIYQFLTIFLTGSPFGPWRVEYVQPWHLRTAAPACNNPWIAQPAAIPADASGIPAAQPAPVG